MTTLGEAADKFEPAKKLNIADLEEVSVDLELHTGTGKNEQGETYNYQFVQIGDNQYRVPASVLEQIKNFKKIKPEIKLVNVTKTGTGLATRYKVEVLS